MSAALFKLSISHLVTNSNTSSHQLSHLDIMDMDMGGSDMNHSSDISMVPFFHFTGGDYVLFKAWHPTSAGAIVGTCIGLICLAIFDRWVAATRGILDKHWRQTGLQLVSRFVAQSSKGPPSPSPEMSEKVAYTVQETPASGTYTRKVPPFILAHDLPRGLLHTGQALLAFVLMLVVMTFNAAYIISIIAGLGIGEAVFGRMGNGVHH